MSKATSLLWSLAGLVLVAGIGWGLYRHFPSDAGAALQQGRLYLGGAVTPLFLLSVGLAVVLGVGASAASRLASRAPPPLARRPALSPLEVVNEDVAIAVREMLVELGQYL
ncbi:general secretion pathway protein E [Stigmatella aurantiaca]|uniref:General secretion pathway protein E n=1 Tax=Stigmatella aurantiaca TaxID=41 RepID=A0A1H7YL05_STIAU|nr:hypothetical protein [Stigmatella aurantiaca]SEM46932.1 general secretion pathway protein E [Stigmatella aurantiaca]